MLDLMSIQRFDLQSGASKSRIEASAGGAVKVPSYLTRIGVFDYIDANGKPQKELRHPADVFSAASLETLENAPIVIGHPAMIDAANWRDLSVGHVDGEVCVDGIYVASDLIIQDVRALAGISTDELVELSCGYTCELVDEVGMYDGVPYTKRQTNIVYNHVGMGPSGWGRMGSEVRLRLDSRMATGDHVNGGSHPGAGVIESSHPPVDGVIDRSHTALIVQDASDSVQNMDLAEALKKLAEAELALTNAKADSAKALARADAAEATAAVLQKDVDSLNAQLAPEALLKAVDARVSLVTSARSVLGSDAKFDGLSDIQVQLKTIEKLDSKSPALAQGRSGDYVQATFDALLARHAQASNANAAVVATIAGNPEARADGAPSKDPRAEMVERNRNAWKVGK